MNFQKLLAEMCSDDGPYFLITGEYSMPYSAIRIIISVGMSPAQACDCIIICWYDRPGINAVGGGIVDGLALRRSRGMRGCFWLWSPSGRAAWASSICGIGHGRRDDSTRLLYLLCPPGGTFRLRHLDATLVGHHRAVVQNINHDGFPRHASRICAAVTSASAVVA